ncbi:MAG: hypothetical protein LBC17_04510, partial [Lactobacillaceae bacterium]|nr:hypothetical protein [Lactobacillaceae bacterium]
SGNLNQSNSFGIKQTGNDGTILDSTNNYYLRNIPMDQKTDGKKASEANAYDEIIMDVEWTGEKNNNNGTVTGSLDYKLNKGQYSIRQITGSITLNRYSTLGVTYAATGSTANNATTEVKIENLQYTQATSSAKVFYQDENGNSIKDPTTLLVEDDKVVGITGLSDSSQGGQMDYAFKPALIKGYMPIDASNYKVPPLQEDVGVMNRLLRADTSSDGLIITYSKSIQAAQLIVNKPDGNKIDISTTGYDNDLIKFENSPSDEELIVDGYTYSVIGPDGQTYNTLQDAFNANPIFDETLIDSDGIDGEVQKFEVQYKSDNEIITDPDEEDKGEEEDTNNSNPDNGLDHGSHTSDNQTDFLINSENNFNNNDYSHVKLPATGKDKDSNEKSSILLSLINISTALGLTVLVKKIKNR